MNKVASTAIYSGVSIGAVVILFSIIFLEPILGQAGAIESVMPYAVTYTRIYIAFSIFNVFNVTMNNIVSSEGSAKTAMCALMTGAVLNVILDPVFIYALIHPYGNNRRHSPDTFLIYCPAGKIFSLIWTRPQKCEAELLTKNSMVAQKTGDAMIAHLRFLHV